MQSAVQKILVVGGNGFVGSAVCRTALARGMQVTSISPSGEPYRTPKGHTPAWVSKVDWHKANALEPDTYAHLLPGVSAVVHTIGTLLEQKAYKQALRDSNFTALASAAVGRGPSSNPLARGVQPEGSYDVLNRDSALRVCEAFLASPSPTSRPRPFVYISAEDCNRPVIPSRYIETKREAERGIDALLAGNPGFRGVYIRPSLIYHAHYRPLISPLAALLDLSAAVHSKVPAGFPTPAGALRMLGSALPFGRGTSGVEGTPLDAMANLLTIPPIHVDHVAEAICIAADGAREDVKGAYGVSAIRELIGWAQKGQEGAHA